MKYFYLIILILKINIAFCQILSPTVITTAGDDYSNQYAKMSVTIGEPVTETISANGNTLTQGFQQGNYYVVNIEENLISGITANVFPNPVQNLINIELSGINESILLNLVDVNGKNLITDKYENSKTVHTLDFSKYSIGTYYLKLTSDKSKYFKTVKIVKTNN